MIAFTLVYYDCKWSNFATLCITLFGYMTLNKPLVCLFVFIKLTVDLILFSVCHILCTIYCVLRSIYILLCDACCFQCTVLCVLCTLYCVQYTVYCVLCTAYCVLYHIYFIMYTLYCIMFTVNRYGICYTFYRHRILIEFNPKHIVNDWPFC